MVGFIPLPVVDYLEGLIVMAFGPATIGPSGAGMSTNWPPGMVPNRAVNSAVVFGGVGGALVIVQEY